MTITPELILFAVLAVVSVGAALGMLFSRNAIHSALFLVLNFAVVSVFFLMLGAPFIAMVQVTVYAGAIMVLFLFVIMLLGAEQLPQAGRALPWQRPLAAGLGLLFLGSVLGYLFLAWGGGGAPPGFATLEAGRDFGGPVGIGQLLFQRYLLPFELTSLLLLVGMIGAVVLTRDERKSDNPKSQPPRPQDAPQA